TLLLSLILNLASGPRSPLVAGYFLILLLATLRFSLPVVWCTTVGMVASYIWVQWWAMTYRPELRIPRYQQMMLVSALMLAGLLAGQIIRRARAVAEDYAVRVDRPPTGEERRC